MSAISDYLLLRKVKQKGGAYQEVKGRENSSYRSTKPTGTDKCDGACVAESPTTRGGGTAWTGGKNMATLSNLSSTLLRKASMTGTAATKHASLYMSTNHERRPRLVKKCGELNIDVESVPKRKRRLLSDFFNTVLDVKWRYHIIIFLMTFVISWIVFATIWYLIGTLSFYM